MRSQSLTQTGVIVADIYMLTHCQQEKRGRREGKLWQVYRMLGEGKKMLLDVKSAQHKSRPIISEMAGEFLKCENFSLDI